MEKQLVLSGKKIFYRVTGNGKPVMLVHGFGETGDVWNSQVNYLQDKFQLIVPDLPGSGKSEMVDDMSMEGMAEILKSILTTGQGHFEVPPSGGFRGTGVSMVGHSMGGYITLAFAEKYPGMLNAFGLFHSTAYADSDEKVSVRRKGIAFIREHGAFEFLKTTTPNLFSGQTKEERPQLVNTFIQSLSNFSAGALVSYYESMIRRPDRTAVLKESKVPVFFMMGEIDNAIPMQDVLQQCHLPNRAYINILDHSGHMGMIEETDKSNQSLEEFLKES